MALRVPQMPSLIKDGYSHMKGLDEAVYRNIDAAKELALLVRSSLGPNGHAKMIINHLDKIFVTSDTSTILNEFEVVHPAAKLLVMASQMMQLEVGDATNEVVILAGELLSKAETLLGLGLVASDIIEGYEAALELSLKYLDDLVVKKLEITSEDIHAAILPVVASKHYGLHHFLASLITEASSHIFDSLKKLNKSAKGFDVDSIRVVKVLGGSLNSSRVIKGMVFAREPEGIHHSAKNARIAIYSCALELSQTETKGTVLLKTSEALLNFSSAEESQINLLVSSLVDAGVNVIVTGSGISELLLHYLNKAGILVVKVLSKFELRRLCKVTGATALPKMVKPTKEELGFIGSVETLEIGSDKVTVFSHASTTDSSLVPTQFTGITTILLRGGTQNFLDDVERAIDDGVNIVKSLTKDNKFVVGGGCSEIALALKLMRIGSVTEVKNSKANPMRVWGIKAFAEALEVIPRTLAENSGLDATDVVSRLYAAHSKEPTEGGKVVTFGVDVDAVDMGRSTKGIVDMLKVDSGNGVDFQVLDSWRSKWWALKLATDAAVTVLKIDQIIMAKPAGGPKLPKGGNQQYEEDD